MSNKFPLKLMAILDRAEHPDIISWLPHGRGFVIRDKKRLADIVLPKYFKESKYTSFTRRLNRWNFTIQTHGHKEASYFHPQFIQGDPQRALEMHPTPQSSNNKRESRYIDKSLFNLPSDPIPGAQNNMGNMNQMNMGNMGMNPMMNMGMNPQMNMAMNAQMNSPQMSNPQQMGSPQMQGSMGPTSGTPVKQDGAQGGDSDQKPPSSDPRAVASYMQQQFQKQAQQQNQQQQPGQNQQQGQNMMQGQMQNNPAMQHQMQQFGQMGNMQQMYGQQHIPGNVNPMFGSQAHHQANMSREMIYGQMQNMGGDNNGMFPGQFQQQFPGMQGNQEQMMNMMQQQGMQMNPAMQNQGMMGMNPQFQNFQQQPDGQFAPTTGSSYPQMMMDQQRFQMMQNGQFFNQGMMYPQGQMMPGAKPLTAQDLLDAAATPKKKKAAKKKSPEKPDTKDSEKDGEEDKAKESKKDDASDAEKQETPAPKRKVDDAASSDENSEAGKPESSPKKQKTEGGDSSES